MTPEERARELVEWLPIEGAEPNDYARQGIAAVIRAAVEAEREACALLADEWGEGDSGDIPAGVFEKRYGYHRNLASVIRARNK